MKIRLTVGDPSNDGHGMKEDVYIESNLNLDQIKASYKNGTKIIGFNLVANVACDYDDSKISKDNFNKLKELLPSDYFFTDDNDDDDDDHRYIDGPDEFALFYLVIAKLGNPSFVYQIESDNVPTIEIGGYGLFSN